MKWTLLGTIDQIERKRDHSLKYFQKGGKIGCPLEGIRVVDQTVLQFGPSAAMMLGDLGAEVIKIEEKNGDPTRGFVRILDYIDCQLPVGETDPLKYLTEAKGV